MHFDASTRVQFQLVFNRNSARRARGGERQQRSEWWERRRRTRICCSRVSSPRSAKSRGTTRFWGLPFPSISSLSIHMSARLLCHFRWISDQAVDDTWLIGEENHFVHARVCPGRLDLLADNLINLPMVSPVSIDCCRLGFLISVLQHVKCLGKCGDPNFWAADIGKC